MSRKKSYAHFLKADIILIVVGVILFVVGVSLPLPNILKIVFIVAGVGLIALASGATGIY